MRSTLKLLSKVSQFLTSNHQQSESQDDLHSSLIQVSSLLLVDSVQHRYEALGVCFR